MIEKDEKLTIVVVGASGDLAKRKIFPALFTLYYQGLLPNDFRIIGFARTEMTRDAFISKISEKLTCRVDADNCEAKMKTFLQYCDYHSGQYDDELSFAKLNKEIDKNELSHTKSNRIFYMAIPPSIFLDVAKSVGKEAMSQKGWTKIIIEKPFGRDSDSSNILNKELAKIFSEKQIYRIDHYLGKELVQNLMVLRFANLILEPIWNRTCIHNVQIVWKEELSVEGRGGYFDEYGIVRDVMQNHLMQILSLIVMEEPVSMDAEDILDEKVKALSHIEPLKMNEIVVGQYQSKKRKEGLIPGYTEDPSVPSNSITPTFAAAVLHVNNRRWDGVPFFLKCGKALDEAKTEIRITFNSVPGNLFNKGSNQLSTNELVIRVQPNEAVYLNIMNKVPGLNMILGKSELDMQYKARFSEDIPEAYERLILDVIRGDKSLFIRDDELQSAWNIFTPVLNYLEKSQTKPFLYPFGSVGPEESDKLAKKYGVKWGS